MNMNKLGKLKTNKNKFKLLAISKLKPAPVVVDTQRIEFCQETKILGLTFRRTGVSRHLSQRLSLAKHRANKLKRFGRLKPKIQLHLYKSLIRSTIEYPSAIHGILSKTNTKRIQQHQNKQIRRAIRASAGDEGLTIEELHNKYKIDAINTRLQNSLKKVYDKLAVLNPGLIRETEALNGEDQPDHYWWRRLSPRALADDEDPVYEFG